MTDTPLKVLGISGSLRRASLNTAALRAARELAPAGMAIELAEIGEIPLYNGDIEGIPAPVQRLRDQITAADALLFAVPEYNYSIPGMLKNAFDWVSRPDAAKHLPLRRKPAALFGCSPGMFGTARAQYHFRQCCVFTDTLLLNKPELMIAQAQAKFDDAGRLTDEPTRGYLRRLLEALRDWTLELR